MKIKNFIKKLEESLKNTFYSEEEFTRVNFTYTEESEDGKKWQSAPQDEVNIELNPNPPRQKSSKKDQEGKEGKPGKPGKEGKGGKEGKEGKGGKEGEGKPGKESEAKVKKETVAKPGLLDTHVPLEIASESSGERIANEMEEEAKELEEQIREKKGSAGQGGGAGNFKSVVERYRKGIIDWKRLLRNKVTNFINRYSESEEGTDLSYAKYYKRERAGAETGVIRKGERESTKPESIVMIVAADTSGSIGQNQLNQFFTEMDSLAMRFEKSSKNAKVYFATWDFTVGSIVEYSHKDLSIWKKSEKMVTGGGGTEAECIFKFIDKSILAPERTPGTGLMKLMGKKPESLNRADWEDKHSIPIEFKAGAIPRLLPLLIIMTDGYFSKMNRSDLGKYYQNQEDKIFWVIMNGITENLYPKENIIEIE